MPTKHPALSLSETLSRDLLTLAQAYASARGIRLSIVGVHMKNDQRFFTDKVPRGAFTAATYDGAVRWFSENWPAGTAWPKSVRRAA